MGNPSTQTVTKTWNRLAQITTLRFVARSAGKTRWSGFGYGSVVVACPKVNTIIFAETGTWQSDAGQQCDFNNTWRWSLHDSGTEIQLEHLRFGPNNPVYLFDLPPVNDHRWQSARPYLCRDDSYSAILILAAYQIQLRWIVKGPHKDEDISYWYA